MPKNLEILDLSHTSKVYYSAATITAPNTKLVHVSGQVGATKSGHVPSDYESQLHLALFNLRKIIVAAGASVKDIAKLTLYIVNYDPKTRKHARHMQRFYGKHRPAMTLVPVNQLAYPSFLVEIDATVAIPSRPSSIPRSLDKPKQAADVIIIGAGLAGLTAARKVSEAGFSSVVLESRDRVGGRTYSLPAPGGKSGIVEAGAGWINDVNQTRMISLVREFNLDLIEQNTTGNCSIQDTNGDISSFPYGEVPKFDPSSVEDIIRIRDGTEADCQAVDCMQPRDTELDSMTFEAYLRSRNASEKAILTATVWTRAMLGIDPRDVSALFFLNYCKSGGGLLQMRSDRKGGGQHLRIRQGTQTISTKLAATLPPNTVRLGSAVREISEEGPHGVDVVTSDGTTFRGRKVICTVPSPVLKTINFQPALHPAKLAWSEAANYGYYSKAMMIFKNPFWISKGFCGLTQSFTGPAAVIRDSCSPTDDFYVLTCFMAGPPAHEWSLLPQKDRIEKLLRQIGELFHSQDIIHREFVDMIMYEWINDEFTGYGCPCAHLPPGVLDSVGPNALREPTGNLHFAGTETSGEWKGYMEGAVLSGERAAKEVITSLKFGGLSKL